MRRKASNPIQFELMFRRDKVIWAAGFVDGEGCIAIVRSRIHHHRFWTYQLHLTVTQKKPEPLQLLKELFGGYISTYQLRGVTYHRIRISSQSALAAIKELLPYLLVKRQVAEVGVRFQEQLNIWNGQYGRRGYPEEVVIGREMFYMEARRLNARSKTNPEAPKYVGPVQLKETVQ